MKAFVKRISIFIVAVIAISFNSPKKSMTPSKDYFEGVITYNISYKPYSDTYDADKLKDYIGSKMILTFKNGNFKKEYYSRDGLLLNVRFCDLQEKKAYSQNIKNDTIYWIDITKNDSETTFKRIKDSIILGYKSRALETHSTVRMNIYSNKPMEISGKYYFAKELAVDPNWYEDYNEGNYNEIIKVGEGMQLIIINNGIFWTQEIVVKKVEKRGINEAEIKINIPENAIFKEL